MSLLITMSQRELHRLEVIQKIRDDRRDLFYSLEFSGTRNHYVSPLQRYADSRTHWLADAFVANRMFFSSNEVGEDLMYFTRIANERSILSL